MIVPTMIDLTSPKIQHYLEWGLFLMFGVVLGVMVSRIGEDKMVNDLKLQLGGGNLVCREKLTDCRNIVEDSNLSLQTYSLMVSAYGKLATDINQENLSGVANDRIIINGYNDKINKFGALIAPRMDNCMHE
jgi:hypothetical protein